MDDMQRNDTQNPMDDPNTAAVYQQKADELQQLVAQQVSQADTSKPTTMTEILADEQGAFAAKAQELGMGEEFAAFKAAQQPIAAMREEFLSIEEKRSAEANKVANISPQLEQEAAATRKTAGIGGAIGAAVAGVAAALGAGKLTKSKPIQFVTAAAAAVFGGAVASIFTARKRAQKGMNKIEAQMGDMTDTTPNAELEQRAQELQNQLGEAQQSSMQTIADAMVERMAEQQISLDKAQEEALSAAPEMPDIPEPVQTEPGVVQDPEAGVEPEQKMSPELAVRAEKPVQSHAEAVLASRAKTADGPSL